MNSIYCFTRKNWRKKTQWLKMALTVEIWYCKQSEVTFHFFCFTMLEIFLKLATAIELIHSILQSGQTIYSLRPSTLVQWQCGCHRSSRTPTLGARPTIMHREPISALRPVHQTTSWRNQSVGLLRRVATVEPLYSGHHWFLEMVSAIERCPL